MSKFEEFGRVIYKGRILALGEESIDDDIKYNAGYYFDEKAGYMPLEMYPEDCEYISKVFLLDTPCIDFDELDELSKKIKSEEKEELGKINIKDYLPKKMKRKDKVVIGDLLGRIQKMFPFVSGEYLKARLPYLTIEHRDKEINLSAAAYFKPGANVFGFQDYSLKTVEGQGFAIHELSHMVSSRVEKDENGNNIYCNKSGFADNFYNGIAITEGFNEILSSLARLSQPMTYHDEVKIASLLYLLSGDSHEVIKNFYEGDASYLRFINDDEMKVKKFIKNLDYHNRAYTFDLNKYIATRDHYTQFLVENLEKHLDCKLGDMPKKTQVEIATMVKEKVDDEMANHYKKDFVENNFLANAEVILIDKLEDTLCHTKDEDKQAVLITQAIDCLTFPRDFAEPEKVGEFMLGEYQKVDDRFREALLNFGLDEPSIDMVFKETYKGYEEKNEEESKNPKDVPVFDDEELVNLCESIKDLQDEDSYTQIEEILDDCDNTEIEL
ncbi:MAG: hypothetical protein MJ232_01955 [archaeon]|nr:hypothetical protein [archaeon]